MTEMKTLNNLKMRVEKYALAPASYKAKNTDYSIEEWRGICKLFRLDPITTTNISADETILAVTELKLKGVAKNEG